MLARPVLWGLLVLVGLLGWAGVAARGPRALPAKPIIAALHSVSQKAHVGVEVGCDHPIYCTGMLLDTIQRSESLSVLFHCLLITAWVNTAWFIYYLVYILLGSNLDCSAHKPNTKPQ